MLNFHPDVLSTLFAPGTLVIFPGMFILTWILRKFFPTTQSIIVVLLASLIYGQLFIAPMSWSTTEGSSLSNSVAGAFTSVAREVHPLMFPSNAGVGLLAGVAVIMMGLFAGSHIRHALTENDDDGRYERESVSQRRAVYKGSRVVVVSVITIGAQIALAFINAAILSVVVPTAVPSFWKLAGALAVIQPIIALPVLVAALHGLGRIHKKVGKLTQVMSLNSELYLWPALITLLAVAGNGHEGHGLEPGPMILWTGMYLGTMFGPIRLAWDWLDRRYGRIAILVLIAVLTASSWTTETLGLHTLMGAVVCGFVMPHGVAHWISKFEKGVQIILVPFFLFNVGLSTRFELTSFEVLVPAVWLTVSTAFIQVNLVSWLGEKYLYFYPAKARAAGWLTTIRGMVEIVVAGSIIAAAIISGPIGQAIILMAIFQTLLGPIMAQRNLELQSKTKLAVMPVPELSSGD